MPNLRLRLPRAPDDVLRETQTSRIGVVGRLPTVVRNAITPPPEPAPDQAALRFGAMVETAFLVAAADGYLSPREIDAIADCIEGAGHELEEEVLADFIDQLADALERDGHDVRLLAIATALPEAATRREALAFAALAALSNGTVGDKEHEALLLIGAAFDIDPAEVERTVTRVADELAASAG